MLLYIYSIHLLATIRGLACNEEVVRIWKATQKAFLRAATNFGSLFSMSIGFIVKNALP